jgi:hypothetical protein
MKKQRKMKTKAQSQKREGIQDALTGMYSLLFGFESLSKLFNETGIRHNLPDLADRSHNQGTLGFLIPNRSNGPPGRSRSPGHDSEIIPDNTSSIIKNIKILNINKLHYLNMKNILNFNQHFNLNYLPIFNSKVMKKQVLISIVALLCASTSFGQVAGPALPGSAPRGINCIDDPLHPIAGRPYIYKAATNQPGGNYTFWATKDYNFITTTAGVTTTNMATKKLTTPGDLIATSSNYATPDLADNVSITWSDAVLNGTTPTTPTFVAVNQDGTCANNFKAWQLLPLKAFTVDIRNIDNADPTGPSLAFGANDNQCFDAVRGAVYNPATSKVEYDFGKQVLYYEVIAANFTASWIPTFTLTGLGNGQTAVIEWDVAKTFPGPTVPVAITNGVSVTTAAVATAETNTANGVSIYVRVTITNNTFQGIAATTIRLAVDGVNSVGDWDIENNTLALAGPLCNVGALNDKMDVADQVLDPRPDVTPVAPSAPFVPGNETN